MMASVENSQCVKMTKTARVVEWGSLFANLPESNRGPAVRRGGGKEVQVNRQRSGEVAHVYIFKE